MEQDYKSTRQCGLARALERFPEEAGSIRQLFLADPSFRNVCADYSLACAGLARVESVAAARTPSEIDEYRTLVRELEAEMMGMLSGAGRGDSRAATP